jgi:hypothetical protein
MAIMNTFTQTIVPRAVGKTTSLLALAAVLSTIGCGSESSDDLVPTASPVSSPTVAVQDSASMAAPVAPPPVAGGQVAPTVTANQSASPFSQPDQGANDQAMLKLNDGLRKFFAQYQRAPYTADELVSEKFVESMPQAPEGKEYFYDSVGLRFKLINKSTP